MNQRPMPWWFYAILLVGIGVEVSVFARFVWTLYESQVQKRQNVKIPVTRLNPKYFIYSPTAQLKYFYESARGTIEVDQPSWLPYPATYTLTSDGLNEQHDYPVKRAPHTFRIMTLGDSFTFGQYVNTADNWPDKLEDLFQTNCQGTTQVQVINLGEAGYDVQYIAHRFKIRGVKYNPDLIIWLESGSGFDRIMELMEPYLSKDPTITYKTESNGFLYDTQWRETVNAIHAKYSDRQIFTQISAAWSDFFRSRGVTKTVIATFADIDLINKIKLKYWTYNQPNTWLDENIPGINGAGYVVRDGHPNVQGQDLIAQSIFQYLILNHLAMCSSK